MKALLLCAVFLAANVFGADFQPPPKPTQYVTDRAGILSADTVATLNKSLADFERQTSNQLLVATFPDIPGGLVMEDFTNRTFDAWGVGQKDRNNGVVLFVFPNQRKMRIEVGYGLEGALPDATAKSIIANEITPAFRDRYYDAGVKQGLAAIMRATRDEYEPRPQPSSSESVEGAPPLFIVVVIIAILLISFMTRGRRRGAYYGPSGRHTYGGGGFGGFGSSSGGGGFSGGGGSSGGGGASGSW